MVIGCSPFVNTEPPSTPPTPPSSPIINDDIDGFSLKLQDCLLKLKSVWFSTQYYIEFYIEVKNELDEINFLYSNKMKVVLVNENKYLKVNYFFEDEQISKSIQAQQKTVVKITTQNLSEETKNLLLNKKLKVYYSKFLMSEISFSK